jgi:DNA-binding MurR/RpiR family transcriptional regulator
MTPTIQSCERSLRWLLDPCLQPRDARPGAGARTQRARIIAVTDSADSPLARIANHVFVTLVHGYSFPESLSGVNAIGNILVGLAMSQMGQQALDRISANEAQMRRSGEMLM